ncbi:uncharacterized protein LOC131845241 [Achroia grisella]|nr:uncharacterized protein LOC131845241 [Achroia grisella]
MKTRSQTKGESSQPRAESSADIVGEESSAPLETTGAARSFISGSTTSSSTVRARSVAAQIEHAKKLLDLERAAAAREAERQQKEAERERQLQQRERESPNLHIFNLQVLLMRCWLNHRHSVVTSVLRE